jgi:hypothetical protein
MALTMEKEESNKISGTKSKINDKEVNRAYCWGVKMLDGANHLSIEMLKGMIAGKPHYHSVKDISEENFLTGIWKSICYTFGGNSEVEYEFEEKTQYLAVKDVLKGYGP